MLWYPVFYNEKAWSVLTDFYSELIYYVYILLYQLASKLFKLPHENTESFLKITMYICRMNNLVSEVTIGPKFRPYALVRACAGALNY